MMQDARSIQAGAQGTRDAERWQQLLE